VKRVSPDLIARTEGFLDDPGISVVDAALTAVEAAPVHAMHDPTEGGLTNGLWELAAVGRKRLVIRIESVPVYPETTAFCERFGLNCWGLIASGTLLIVVAAADEERVVSALDAKQIACRKIGTVQGSIAGVSVMKGGVEHPLQTVPRDEFARLLEEHGL
jgi:hydrogenase maturation factor